MIDIHSHLIFDVDDGACSLNESLRMLEYAEKNNIHTIVATPHFQSGIFNINGVVEKFEILVRRGADYCIDIRLGSEVFADDEILGNLKSKKNLNFSNLGYLLAEMPFNASFDFVYKLICKISAANIKLIIAHPERNYKIMKNSSDFIKLVKTTKSLIQLDAGSVSGVYGVFVREAARHLLKIKAVDFIASNAHCANDYMVLYPAAVHKIYQLCDEEYAYRLLEVNAREIITVEGCVGNYGRETC